MAILRRPSTVAASSVDREIVQADEFWNVARGTSLSRRLEKRNSARSTTTADSVGSAVWALGGKLDEQLGDLGQWRTSVESGELESASAQGTEQLDSTSGQSAEHEETSKRPSFLWQLGIAVDDKLTEFAKWRKACESEVSQLDNPGHEVFWVRERRASLARRLEQRMSRRDAAGANEASASSEQTGWPRARSLLMNLGFRFDRDTDEHTGDTQTVSPTSPTVNQRSGSVVGGSVEDWRASTVVAAGRSTYWLQVRKCLRELGMQIEDEEGQVLVECLCDPEGPWQPLQRPLPLAQVTRCASALWEAEVQPKAASADNPDCVQA